MDMKFKPYDDDQGLLPLNEEESRVDSLIEEDGTHHARGIGRRTWSNCKSSFISLMFDYDFNM